MVERINERWKRWGAELQRIRLHSGETMQSLAQKAAISRQLIGKYEQGTRAPSRDKVDALDDALATGGRLRQYRAELMEDAHIPAEFRDALLMEQRSQEIREYHSVLIPGLLQTASYARSLVSARRVRDTPEQIEQIVATRTERLKQLRETRPLLCFVVDEVAISRTVGDEKIMQEQRNWLIELAERGTIRLQLITNLPRHPGLCSPFRLMSLDGSRAVAFLEDALGGRSATKPQEIAELGTVFGLLQAEALSPDASIERIRETNHVRA
ncbi:helix-turn-helix protein [Haloactinospora alba]|uniref:Helix-turn-helix protein n=1 Tax=Haloactinospora alba TaxID=405555 RepID=A0A543NAC4_9ACTN|nr:helix-turn-helix transcriptional regulator [Haloactinospora alba]TQN28765.1 helix-turn-helix protein [Haloactinospora alba]